MGKEYAHVYTPHTVQICTAKASVYRVICLPVELSLGDCPVPSID